MAHNLNIYRNKINTIVSSKLKVIKINLVFLTIIFLLPPGVNFTNVL